jgi:hypothetical protein
VDRLAQYRQRSAAAAQRSGSARAASSGPTALPSTWQADNFFSFFFFLSLYSPT